MADLGAVTSATQLVQQTFHLYRHLSAAQSFAGTAGTYAGMIAFEYFRFETWIQQSGLLTTDDTGSPTITEDSINQCLKTSWDQTYREAFLRNLVRNIEQVHVILNTLDAVKTKYRLDVMDEDIPENINANAEVQVSSPPEPSPSGKNSKALFAVGLVAKAITKANRQRQVLSSRVSFFKKVKFGWALNDDTSDRQKIMEYINSLKYYNDGLREMLAPRERAFADAVVGVRAVSLSEDSAELTNIATAARGLTGQLYHDISTACAIKAERQQQQTAMASTASYSSLHPPKILAKFQIARFDELVQKSSEKPRQVSLYYPETSRTPESSIPVIVEFVVFDPSLEVTELKLLQERIRQLSELLQTIDRPSTFIFPISTGFLHFQRSEFAIIYQPPDFADPYRDTTSLYSVIRRNPRSRAVAKSQQLWPTLEEKYQLAAAVAEGLLALLSVNWVHKALTSANVVMFHKPGSMNAVEFARPQIMGFGVSRPDKPGDITIDVRSLDTPWSLWQHPDLRAVPHRRYYRYHDIYSLGMILFEIGMWQDLHYLSVSDDSPIDFHRRVVNDCHRKLAHYVGEAYRDVVLLCIDKDEAWIDAGLTDGGTGSAAPLLELFSWDVVRVLRKLDGASI